MAKRSLVSSITRPAKSASKARKQQTIVELDESIDLHELNDSQSETESFTNENDQKIALFDSDSEDLKDTFLEEEESDESTSEPELEDVSSRVSDGDEEPADQPDFQSSITDVKTAKEEIERIVSVLQNFKSKRDPAISRSQYVARLTEALTFYYGYSEFILTKFMALFPIDEAIEFFSSNETPRPVTIRTNTLKIRRKQLAQMLIARGVNVDPLEGGWSKVGLVVHSSQVPIGATPEYLAGYYMLQSASSFLPVVALDPQPGERILDMCAAPGGKTCYIASCMGNTGTLVANEVNVQRIKALLGNLHRQGVRNCIVAHEDGRSYPRIMGHFDRILLDAPCSGSGVVSKDSSVKVSKGPEDFQRLSSLQRELILAALDSLKPGGTLVYSTCSVMIEENEAVVDWLLRKRSAHVMLVDTGLTFGKEGFRSFMGKHFLPTLSLTRRFYPHVHNMDGFFVAKFVRKS